MKKTICIIIGLILCVSMILAQPIVNYKLSNAGSNIPNSNIPMRTICVSATGYGGESPDGEEPPTSPE